MIKQLKTWWNEGLDPTRVRLSRHDALIQLAVLGVLTGLLAGGTIVLFRLLVENLQEWILPGTGAENYEALAIEWRFLLPLLGALFLAAMFRWFSHGLHVLGVARVMERMAYHQGHLSLRGFLLQFFGAAAAIISGHSVGREGPHVYLGAGAASLLGQRLELPNNSIRTLVACGTAAGIAASFNTPLAGVFFALEVVMMEYTVASFMPVILAAVSATALSQWILGAEAAFNVPDLHLNVLAELPVILLLGFLTGAVAALFIHLLKGIAVGSRGMAIWWRLLLAGCLMGIAGMLMPEVMGIGYDSVNAALLGQYGLMMLTAMLLLKLISTSVCIGLGVPGGMIGPALFLGACLGSLTGLSAGEFMEIESHVGFYAMLGMGAMMGASLQAPLAALTAMMELTHSPQMIMPGMLVIVVASLTASELFGKESLFITMLKASGLDYEASPVMQALRRLGVAGVMNVNFIRVDEQIKPDTVRQLLDKQPDWLLVEQAGQPAYILPALDLARAVESLDEIQRTDSNFLLTLSGIPARREQVASVHLNATLQEALDELRRKGVNALYVTRTTAPGIERIYGILTKGRIESAYKY
jgi:CIC family chloride channel protein